MSELNYLKDLPLHQFEEAMTISECSFATIAMADHEWAAIQESVDLSGVSLFEAELLGLDEAQTENFVEKVKNLGKKIIELLKKIASYIMGFISKWLVSIGKLVNKDALNSKDKGRCLRGAEKLTADGKTVKLYGLLLAGGDKSVKYNEALAFLMKNYGPGKINSFASITENDIPELEAKKDEIGNNIRGTLVGTDAVESKDFRAAVTKFLTGYAETNEYEFNAGQLKDAVIKAAETIKGGAKDHKKVAADGYDKIKKAISKMIDVVKNASVQAKGIQDDSAKKAALAGLSIYGAIYKEMGSIMAAANSACLSVLSADYRMNSQLVLKCYVAGGSDDKAKKDTKKEAEKAEKEAPTNESVESIFGMDLI